MIPKPYLTIHRAENGYIIQLLHDGDLLRSWVCENDYDLSRIIREALAQEPKTPYPPLTQEKIPDDDIPF